MDAAQSALWQKINSFSLDDPASDYSFSDRLARENGWTLEYSLRAIHEYKRFMFLICIAPHPLTPSDEVDQVWHLHLLYTQSYWIDFCEKTIGRHIHHGPTKGGSSERHKYDDWYRKTLDLYAEIFDRQAAADLWPPSEKRFGDIDFQRINTAHHWILKKPQFLRK